MKARLLPEHMARLVSPSDRKKFGIITNEDAAMRSVARSERELQTQIINYLRLRGIEPLWHRTNKKSHATIGWPDITFGVLSNGFPVACAYEVKFGSGTLSREQNDMLERMQARPNAWRVRVIRNFVEVVDDLRELGL